MAKDWYMSSLALADSANNPSCTSAGFYAAGSSVIPSAGFAAVETGASGAEAYRTGSGVTVTRHADGYYYFSGMTASKAYQVTFTVTLIEPAFTIAKIAKIYPSDLTLTNIGHMRGVIRITDADDNSVCMSGIITGQTDCTLIANADSDLTCAATINASIVELGDNV